jgi:hypothetical protein
MNKLKMFGLALIATFALGAIVVSSASAEEAMPLLAEWLINGAAIVTEENFSDPGEFIFGEKGVQKVKCSYITMGKLKPNGEGEYTEILSLTGAVVNLTAQLLCKNVVGCEEPAENDIEASPENLPWKLLATLGAGGEFLETVEKETWVIDCLMLGLLRAIECTFTSTEYELLNVAGGVEVMGNSKPFGSCPGKPNTFEMEQVPESGDESTTGTLTVSSV